MKTKAKKLTKSEEIKVVPIPVVEHKMEFNHPENMLTNKAVSNKRGPVKDAIKDTEDKIINKLAE